MGELPPPPKLLDRRDERGEQPAQGTKSSPAETGELSFNAASDNRKLLLVSGIKEHGSAITDQGHETPSTTFAI